MKATAAVILLSGFIGIISLTGCEKTAGATGGATDGGKKGFHSPLPDTTNSAGTQVAWSTSKAISATRQIEVGDHPNIQLEKFEVGQRAERVRFMMADQVNVEKFVSGSPQDLLFQSDAAVAKSENDKWSLFSMVIDSPINMSMSQFSGASSYNGLAISPQLVLCAASALQNLKDASSTRSAIYQNWQINDINIFVKPVQHAADAESKLAIDTKLHALNFQISLWTRSGDCFTPSVDDVGTALDVADQRVEQ